MQRHPLFSLVSAFMVCLLAAGSLAAAPLKVVSTTGMIDDLVRQVGGDRVEAVSLMGPGVDPHLYKATASDVIKLQRAKVIFYNGLHLEGKMGELLARLAKGGRTVHAIGEDLPADRLLHPAGEEHPDPHVWFDIALWAEATDGIARVLTAADPDGAKVYAANAAAARERLTSLDAWARAKVAELPAARRVLITSHDAYGYFGRAYGFEVVGLQGISTVSEASLAGVARLVDFIRERGIKAIFVESSVPPAMIKRIADDAGVVVGGELFSDAMGTPGQMENGHDLGTYEGMVRHNLTTIVEALK